MWTCPGILRRLNCPYPANMDPEGPQLAPASPHSDIHPSCSPHTFAKKPSLQGLPLGSELETRAPGRAEGPGIPPKWARQDQTIHREAHLPVGLSSPQPKLNITHCQKHPRDLPQATWALRSVKVNIQAFLIFSASWLWSLS